MVKRKSTYSGGRSYKRRRTYYKKPYHKSFNYGSSSGRKSGAIYAVTKTAMKEQRDFSGILPSRGNAYAFHLNELTDFAGIQGLYDEFMISWVKLKCFININVNTVNTTTAGENPRTLPRIAYATDYNDDDVPASEDELLQYSDCQIFQAGSGNNYFTKWIKPKTAQMLYRGATTTSYSAKGNTWVATANADTPHYGFKYFFTIGSNPNYSLIVYATYYLKFRMSK